MEIKLNNEIHKVVYIEYQDGLPFSVKTTFYVPNATSGPYWRIVDWDFFANNGDQNDLRYYQSGSGGSPKEIQAPKWADGYTGKYWLASDARLKGKVKNGRRLKNPLSLKAWYLANSKFSKNPFHCAEESNSCEFCEVCGHDSTEFCDEHKYTDEKGNDRYKHNNETV